VNMASTLAKERDRVPMTERPFAYQIEIEKERTDIVRIYRKFETNQNGDATEYAQAVYDTNQIVKCDGEEMERERKALMRGIFDSTPKSQKLLRGKSPKSSGKSSKKMKIDLTEKPKIEDLTETETASLPKISSCIDHLLSAQNESLIEMIGDEETDANSKEKEKKKKEKEKRHWRESSSSSKHRKKKRVSVDLTEENGKISGMSTEAKALLKDGKDKIGLFARKYLAKALKAENAQCEKEDFKVIAKKVTTKVFEDFRKRFKAERSVKSLDYDEFMAAKRKRKVEGLIKAYVKRDVTQKQKHKKHKKKKAKSTK